MASSHKLVVVRTDAINHESTFTGWHSETASMRCFNEAKADKRTLYAAWFIGNENSVAKCDWEIRAQWSKTAAEIEADNAA